MENKYVDLYKEITEGRDIYALSESTVKFATETFNYQSPNPAIHHLAKEVIELVEQPYDLEEYADCLLILLHALDLAGHSLPDLLKKAWEKHEKNKKRKWGKPDVNGVIEHIRDDE